MLSTITESFRDERRRELRSLLPRIRKTRHRLIRLTVRRDELLDEMMRDAERDREGLDRLMAAIACDAIDVSEGEDPERWDGMA